jgi:hypothetical protein
MEKTTAHKTNKTSLAVKTLPMPNKTLLLIGILSAITLILLGLALYISVPKVNPTPKVINTTLSVSKPVATATSYTANITLNTERAKITAAQIELTFDPTALTKVDIKPGTYFVNPTVLYKKVDQVNGKITYMLGIGMGQKAGSGNGTVAILSFTPIAKNGTTTIAFQKTSKVTTTGVVTSVLTNAVGVKFAIK